MSGELLNKIEVSEDALKSARAHLEEVSGWQREVAEVLTQSNKVLVHQTESCNEKHSELSSQLVHLRSLVESDKEQIE